MQWLSWTIYLRHCWNSHRFAGSLLGEQCKEDQCGECGYPPFTWITFTAHHHHLDSSCAQGLWFEHTKVFCFVLCTCFFTQTTVEDVSELKGFWILRWRPFSSQMLWAMGEICALMHGILNGLSLLRLPIKCHDYENLLYVVPYNQLALWVRVIPEYLSTWVPAQKTWINNLFIVCSQNHNIQSKNHKIPKNMVFKLPRSTNKHWLKRRQISINKYTQYIPLNISKQSS